MAISWSQCGSALLFFSPGFLCECVCETTWIRNFVFKWGPKFRILHPSLEMDKNNKKSLVFFSMEISWPWQLSRFWMWNAVFVSIKTVRTFPIVIYSRNLRFLFRYLSIPCSEYGHGTWVQLMFTSVWKKYDKWPDFLKQSTKRYLPVSWLKTILQEETPDLLSVHPLHLKVFWAGVGSAQCWLNSTITFTDRDSQWFIRSRAKSGLLKKSTVRSCPEVPIWWWRPPPGLFNWWL